MWKNGFLWGFYLVILQIDDSVRYMCLMESVKPLFLFCFLGSLQNFASYRTVPTGFNAFLVAFKILACEHMHKRVQIFAMVCLQREFAVLQSLV